jgi:hypothetical protein
MLQDMHRKCAPGYQTRTAQKCRAKQSCPDARIEIQKSRARDSRTYAERSPGFRVVSSANPPRTSCPQPNRAHDALPANRKRRRFAADGADRAIAEHRECRVDVHSWHEAVPGRALLVTPWSSKRTPVTLPFSISAWDTGVPGQICTVPVLCTWALTHCINWPMESSETIPLVQELRRPWQFQGVILSGSTPERRECRRQSHAAPAERRLALPGSIR